MNPRVLSLFLSWTELRPEEREGFDAVVRTFLDLSDFERQRRLEEIGRIFVAIDVGPLKAPCPSCGR